MSSGKKNGLFTSLLKALIKAIAKAPASILKNSSKAMKQAVESSSRTTAPRKSFSSRSSNSKPTIISRSHDTVRRIGKATSTILVEGVGKPASTLGIVTAEMVGQIPKIALKATSDAVVKGGKELGKGLVISTKPIIKPEGLEIATKPIIQPHGLDFPNKAIFPPFKFQPHGIKFDTGKLDFSFKLPK